MSTVPIFSPKISIVLKKNVGRTSAAENVPASTRYQGANRTIDLTPFLGDHGSVVTRKSVRDDAGTFSITLVDRVDGSAGETLYALIEPMDVIEIRMAHDPSKYAGKGLTAGLPLKMRGLVTAPSRPMVMTDRGPVRSVQITGQDYGKLLAMCQIAYLPNMVTGQFLVSEFNFFANYNSDSAYFQSAPEFVQSTVDKVINPFIVQMQQAVAGGGPAKDATVTDQEITIFAKPKSTGLTSPIVELKTDVDRVQVGEVSPFGLQSWPGGSIIDMLKYFGDVGPWNEMYVEDREDAPYLVYRPNPFKTAGGAWIQEPYIGTAGARPGINTATNADIVSWAPTRSDMNVANYYWVDAPRFSVLPGGLLQMAAANAADADKFYIPNYPNSATALYGFRKLEVQTQQGPRFDGHAEGDVNTKSQSLYDFIGGRRQVLIDTNKDNVVFEAGEIVVRGDESLLPGNILNLTRGSTSSEMYMVAVTNNYMPFGSYTTAVEFERGTDFIQRVLDGRAVTPYYAEQSPGGVYGSNK